MLVEPRAESWCPTCWELSRGFPPGVAPDAAGARPACAAALRPGPRPAESARHPVPDQRRQRVRDRIDDPPQRPFSEPVGRAQPHCRRFVQQPVHGDPAARRLVPACNLVVEGRARPLRENTDPLVELPVQVVLVKIHHHAHPLDFRIGVDRQPPSLPQLGQPPIDSILRPRNQICWPNSNHPLRSEFNSA